MEVVMISHIMEAVLNMNRLSKKMFWIYIGGSANDEVFDAGLDLSLILIMALFLNNHKE